MLYEYKPGHMSLLFQKELNYASDICVHYVYVILQPSWECTHWWATNSTTTLWAPQAQSPTQKASTVCTMHIHELIPLCTDAVSWFVIVWYILSYCSGVVKPDPFKIFPDEPPNTTNVEETLERILNNDSSMTEVNLNNIKVSKANKQTKKSQFCILGYIKDPLCLLYVNVTCKNSNTNLNKEITRMQTKMQHKYKKEK